MNDHKPEEPRTAPRRARFTPENYPEHENYGLEGWAYPPNTYDPGSVDDGDAWTFAPDDKNGPNGAIFPNFASIEDFTFLRVQRPRDN